MPARTLPITPLILIAPLLAVTAAAGEAQADETAIFAALAMHLEENEATTMAGLYPDGTPLEPVCEQFGYTVCVAEAFMRAHDTGAALTAAEALSDPSLAIIDVRGAGERELIPIGETATHAVRFGGDAWDPTTVGILDRELFADEVLGAVGSRETPVALLCMAGVRSRAAAMALREAGFGSVVNVSDGVIGGPTGPGMAGALGIELPAPEGTAAVQ